MDSTNNRIFSFRVVCYVQLNNGYRAERDIASNLWVNIDTLTQLWINGNTSNIHSPRRLYYYDKHVMRCLLELGFLYQLHIEDDIEDDDTIIKKLSQYRAPAAKWRRPLPLCDLFNHATSFFFLQVNVQNGGSTLIIRASTYFLNYMYTNILFVVEPWDRFFF